MFSASQKWQWDSHQPNPQVCAPRGFLPSSALLVCVETDSQLVPDSRWPSVWSRSYKILQGFLSTLEQLGGTSWSLGGLFSLKIDSGSLAS